MSDPARNRFFVIQAMRWTGLALVVVGLMIVNRKIAMPQVLGYGLTVIGLIEALIVPTFLAKMWKTPGR